MDLMLEGVQILDYNWRYVYVNEAVLQHSRYSREELLGYTILEKYPGIENSTLFRTMERCMTNRVEEKLENEFTYPDGTIGYFNLRLLPVAEGIVIFSVDRTDFKHAEERFLKVSRLYAFISAINQSIVQTSSEPVLLNNACRVAIEIGNFRMSWIGLIGDDEKLTLVNVCGEHELAERMRTHSGMSVTEEPMRSNPTGRVFSTGQYVVSNHAQADPQLAAWKEAFERSKINSLVVFPIKKFGKVVGTFGFMSRVENFFDEAELALLTEAVGDISFALENFDRARKHQHTEELVMKNEKRFRALIENSADMKTLTTVEGEHIYASPAVTTILGYTPEEMLKLQLRELIHPDDFEAFTACRLEVSKTPGASQLFQHRRLHKNGHWIWCEGSITNMLHEPGVRAMVSNSVDITERKLAEQQREFSRNNLRALINNTNDLLWSVDRNFNLITSNKPFQQWINTRRNEPIKNGESVFTVNLSDDSKVRFKAAYERAFAGESFTQIEYNSVPDESWMEISYSPIWENSHVAGAACHSRDITERKRSEAHLQKTVQELTDYKYALDVSSIIAITDKRGTITFVNDNFCTISHYRLDELIGQDHRLVNSGYHSKEFFAELWATIARGFVWKGEIKNRTKSGTDYWVNTTIIPFLDKHNKPYQYMAIRQDITERKLAEETLIHKNEELEKTNTELDRFVYSASHDLRSPLASILGLLYFIETESTEPHILDYARMIHESINRLDGFIKNILNYSRNNRTEREVLYIPVHKILSESTSLLGKAVGAARIRFEVDVNEAVPFYSDAQRVAIVIENLVGNAIKFIDEEKTDHYIRISGEVQAHQLVLHITDNGIGIPVMFLPKIFNMFYRLDSSRAGSGIGLYIVKETLEVLEGSITVTSKEKEGTTFTVTFKNFGAPVQAH